MSVVAEAFDHAAAGGDHSRGIRGVADANAAVRTVSQTRQRGMAIFLWLLAVVTFLAFGLGVRAGVHAAFIIQDAPSIHVGELHMDVRIVAFGLAIAIAAVGVVLYTWKRERGVFALFGLGTLLFLWAFLTWAARGNSLAFTAMLAATLISATPMVYGTLSGIMCERSGVINIAIEGQFLGGAFAAAVIESYTGNFWLGVLAGALIGGLFGLLLAFFALRYGADQIIVGVLIVTLSTGLTNFLTTQVLSPYQNLNSPVVAGPLRVPLLSKIPVLGPVLFAQNVFVYMAAALIVIITVALFRTRWGLRIRSVGEHPQAASTVGLRVIRTRYSNVILGGVVAGVGGAAYTIGSIGQFAANDMTGGLGYVALAAMIFGRWRPTGALGATLLFGFGVSLSAYLGILGVGIPSEFLSMAPYIITIAVVSGLVGRVRPPAADGKPFARE